MPDMDTNPTTTPAARRVGDIAATNGGMISRLIAAASNLASLGNLRDGTPRVAPWAPPASLRARQSTRPALWGRASVLLNRVVKGRLDLRMARDGRVYRVGIAHPQLTRLHRKVRGKSARRADKRARRLERKRAAYLAGVAS